MMTKNLILSLLCTMVMEVWRCSFVWLELNESYIGGSVARFAGQNVHRRLVQEESYQHQNYEDAMRRAFLGTDEDMLAGACYSSSGCKYADLAQIVHTQEILPDAPQCLLWSRKTKFSWYERFFFLLEIAVLKHDRAQANAGDSRVVLSMKGQVKPLSFDHKPGNECSSLSCTRRLSF